MYCSTCGIDLNPNLNYCNGCGTPLERKGKEKGTVSHAFGGGAVVVAAIGLMAFYPIMRELLRSELETPAKVVLLIAYLLTVAGMFGVLVWNGRRLAGGERPQFRPGADDYSKAFVQRHANTARLEEYREPAISVTEHTTRTLQDVTVRRE